jgi:hypothetical protein
VWQADVQVDAEKKNSSLLETRVENMQLSIQKLQEQLRAAAASNESENARACADVCTHVFSKYASGTALVICTQHPAIV